MSGSRGRYVRRWLADSFRFAWALLYWNARKAAYVRRGRTGRCPCQNPSDDSVPRRVRCDAIARWHEGARFQAICPLLVATADGWRCGVSAAGVRPFWGRAAAFGAAVLLGVYLAATLLLFAGFNLATGARVNWLQVAWPPRWSEIRAVQADHLFGQAMHAFRRGEMSRALLALSSATRRDPDNYEATLLLGQIAHFQGSYLHADEIFAGLMRSSPNRLPRTAVTYHDTLLALGRMDQLAQHCVVMASADGGHAALWVRSLLIALRADRRAAVMFAADGEGLIQSLAPHAQLLVRAELEQQMGSTAGARRLLEKPFGGPFNPLYMQWQVERLAEVGDVAAAQTLLDYYGPILGEFAHAVTQLSLHRLAGEDWAARMLFRRLLAAPLDERRTERLAAELIVRPDAGLYRELQAKLRAQPNLSAGVDGPTLWVTGLACGASDEAAFWRKGGRQPGGETYPDTAALDFSNRDPAEPSSVIHVINAVTLPRDVILALLSRLESGRTQPPARGAR